MHRLRQIAPVLLILLLLSLCIWSITQELQEYSLEEIEQNLAHIPRNRKLEAIALTVLGYLTITGYDFLGFRYIRRSLAPAKIIFTSFLSYAIGNTIGFTLFSGTAIRYRFYSRWGVSSVQIAKIIAFTHLSFWLGMFGIGGVVFLIDPLTLPTLLDLPFKSVHPLGILFLSIVGLYLLASLWYRKPLRIKQEELALPSTRLSMNILAVASLDWGLAAAVLYRLLPSTMPLSYPSFFGIYVLALTAGIISTVPGGLGVFETVILLLRPPSVPAPAILGTLLAYRGIYYFLPLIVAILLWLVRELQRK
ncbi:UPF0104 family protein [Pleurocapsales cyanobacterium LEGE 06147]|nr:UPF0104 family protein [Pleurocapsales cyanobacterium LEGE 06147]